MIPLGSLRRCRRLVFTQCGILTAFGVKDGAADAGVVARRDRRRWITRAGVEQLLRERSAVEKTGSATTVLQAELQDLISIEQFSNKQEMVNFFERAKQLVASHATQLKKENLVALLRHIGGLGSVLSAPQLQNWCRPFWIAVSIQTANLAMSYSIVDLSEIVDVYAKFHSRRGIQAVKSAKQLPAQDSESLRNTLEMMFRKLLVIVDLRLRQVEGKEELFPLKEKEKTAILSFLGSAGQLEDLHLAPALLRRLLLRIMSSPDLWSEEDMIYSLDALSQLRYHDQHANFCGFVLTLLSKKEAMDQHMLCAIVKRLPAIQPKRMSNARLNTTLFKSLRSPNTLSMSELSDLVNGLSGLDAKVLTTALSDIADEFLERSAECTPYQLASFTFNLSKFSRDFSIVEYCIAAAAELNKRVARFTANDMTKMMVGFVHMNFHLGDSCLTRVIGHATDILLEDDIMQEQSEKLFCAVEDWYKMEGFEAKAALDDLGNSGHYAKRQTKKTLENRIRGTLDREKPKYQTYKLDNFTGSEIAAFLFVLAQVDAANLSQNFTEFAKEEILRETINLTARDLSLACQALAISCRIDHRFFKFALDRIAADDDASGDPVIQARLGQCRASMRVLGKTGDTSKLDSDSYLVSCYEAWLKDELSPDATPHIVKEAAHFLELLGLENRLRSPLQGGLFVADTVTGKAEQKFALERKPDPFENDAKRILGEARWRFRMLDALGWTVLYINEDAWKGADDQSKMRYLEGLVGMKSA